MKSTSPTFLLAALLLFILPVSVAAQGISPAFNPHQLIPDTAFVDTATFGGSAGIQTFLEQKGSVLANTSLAFRLKLREPDDALLKEKLGDPNPATAAPRTAAQLIWDAAQASGLNPQVILVTLNKEQSLITGSFSSDDRLQRALDHAMGFACPDGGGCDGTFNGFYPQLFGNYDAEDNRYLGAAKSLVRSFQTPDGRGPYYEGKTSRVGDTIILQNTLGGFDGVSAKQEVILGNRSTAALYRYTPHVFNGNYNFWRFYTAWFEYPNGTIIKSLADSSHYLIQGGKLRRLPNFVARVREMDLSQAVVLSQTELAQYQKGELYQPLHNTVGIIGGEYYLFVRGTRYPVSRFVLKQKNIATTNTVRITQAEADLYPVGERLLPANGTALRVRGTRQVYYMQGDVLRLTSPLTVEQYGLADRVELATWSEVKDVPKEGYLPPVDGTLVASTRDRRTIYIMKDGVRLPLPRTLFLNLRYKVKDVNYLEDAELESFAMGEAPTPREGTYFKVDETGDLYLFSKGERHPVFAQLASEQQLDFPYSFPLSAVESWPLGAPAE